MKKLEIILDADGVLDDPIEKVLRLYNKEYNDNLKKEDITDWHLDKFQKPGSDIQKYFNNPGFFRDLPLIEEAQYYVEKLIKDGHDVIVATHAPKNGIIDKFEYIEEHFPFIGYDNIIPIKRKNRLTGDVMLDDGLHNLLTCQCKYPVIFDWPWNRNLEGEFKALKGIKRISSWKEFYYYITSIAQDKIS